MSRRTNPEPCFDSVDNYTATLLDLVGDTELTSNPAPRREWDLFVEILSMHAAHNGGEVDPNGVREHLRGRIAPRRIGAFYHKAAAAGMIRPLGWLVSDDVSAGNAGRPVRFYEWLGAAS